MIKINPRLLLLSLLLLAFVDLHSQNKLLIRSEVPTWATELKIVNLGNYWDYLVSEKNEIIAFIGDKEYHKTKEIVPPTENFLFLTIGNEDLFLKFIEYRKAKNKKNIHRYELGDTRVILELDESAPTKSGVGWGGDFLFYKKEILIFKLRVWLDL